MPDIFGNPTPQEVQQELIASQQQRLAALFENAERGQDRGGIAIGAALGGAFRKTRDTSKARKSEAERLVEETGMSVAEARAQAKQNVPREFDQVRKAKELRKITGGAEGIIAALEPSMGLRRAQAQTARIMSVRLRLADMPEEANNLITQAALLEEEQDGLDSVKALDKVKLEQAKKTLETTDTPELQDQIRDRARLEGIVDTSKDPEAIKDAQRDLVQVNQRIATIALGVGKSEEDLLANPLIDATPPTVNMLQKNLDEAMNQVDLLAAVGETFDPVFLTFEGQAKNFGFDLFEKAGGTLSPEQKQFVSDYSEFRRVAVDGLNKYIKFITGAQMSEAEATRLRQGYADVEHDGPTKFMSKYMGTVKQIMAYRRRAIASLSGEGLALLPTEMGKPSDDAKDRGNFGSPVGEFLPTDDEARAFIGLAPETVEELEAEPTSAFTDEQLNNMSTQDLIELDAANKQ